MVEEPPKRGFGRPPKVSKMEEECEVQDAVVEAMQSMPDQFEAYDAHLRVRHRKRKYDEEAGSHVEVLSKAFGKDADGMRIPGGTRGRDSRHEGPQVKLRLCNWVEKTHADLGGTDEVYDLILHVVAEQWGLFGLRKWPF